MATISCIIQVNATVSTLDATTLANVIKWVDDNIRAKLPTNATITISFNITP